MTTSAVERVVLCAVRHSMVLSPGPRKSWAHHLEEVPRVVCRPCPNTLMDLNAPTALDAFKTPATAASFHTSYSVYGASHRSPARSRNRPVSAVTRNTPDTCNTPDRALRPRPQTATLPRSSLQFQHKFGNHSCAGGAAASLVAPHRARPSTTRTSQDRAGIRWVLSLSNPYFM